jgi:hypothetical protein
MGDIEDQRAVRLEQAGGGRGVEPGIHDGAQRLPGRVHQPHIQPGSSASTVPTPVSRAPAPPPGMAVAPGVRAGDPLAHAVVQRGAAVQGRRDLQPHPGPPGAHAVEEAHIELFRRHRVLGGC